MRSTQKSKASVLDWGLQVSRPACLANHLPPLAQSGSAPIKDAFGLREAAQAVPDHVSTCGVARRELPAAVGGVGLSFTFAWQEERGSGLLLYPFHAEQGETEPVPLTSALQKRGGREPWFLLPLSMLGGNRSCAFDLKLEPLTPPPFSLPQI